jgi:hypothetical protein
MLTNLKQVCLMALQLFIQSMTTLCKTKDCAKDLENLNISHFVSDDYQVSPVRHENGLLFQTFFNQDLSFGTRRYD